MLALLPVFGVLAGVLTTMAGLGGGILLLLGLSIVWGPAAALASTAPAMLFGNLHRLWLLREEFDRPTAKAFAWGAVPGSFLGGLMAAWMPEDVLRWLMLAMTAAALGRAFGLYTWKPRAAAMTPAGLGIGAISATAGGAGLLVGPLFMAAGLTGKRFVGTIAAAAVALHTGRVAAYGLGGMMTEETVVRATVLTVAVMGGNMVGLWLRDRVLDERRAERLELGALVVCMGLSMLGVGKG
ncbi:TSUP family transporter [Polyangium sp. y55x31]|uniref:TSUP family transporter n=1 Tax=Polyangium sp. y55x31 TaxID=3042688 RepID=UPI0024822BB7|nr:TSUP family transporter [Polyangium sp. y55x31]MDI1484332.1 TSUP family transporter [Polyangium sp. y55x31]